MTACGSRSWSSRPSPRARANVETSPTAYGDGLDNHAQVATAAQPAQSPVATGSEVDAPAAALCATWSAVRA